MKLQTALARLKVLGKGGGRARLGHQIRLPPHILLSD